MLVSTLSMFGTTLAVVSSPGAAAAGIGTDRTKIARLEQRIASEGARAQSLVKRYDRVEGKLGMIKAELASTRKRLVAEQRAEAGAKVKLRRLAVDAYVNAESGSSSSLAMFTTANAATLPEQETYLAVSSGGLNIAATAFQLDANRTATGESALRAGEAETATTLTQLTSARMAAQAGIAADETTLSQVSGNLQALVTAANERRQQAVERAEEEALAAAAARQAAAASATTQPTTTQPMTTQPMTTQPTTTQPMTTQPTTTQPTTTQPTTTQPAPGGYANPLRATSALAPERIDQGVDYSGFGPIYAVGDGVVLSTVNAGWPGGTFISYRLTDGPANGLVVYAAEDIEPTVQVGESVTSSTALGQMYEGPSGIETGWADPSGQGATMAAADGQFNGSNSTSFGYNFSQLLSSLGAVGGVLQNTPPTGDPPPGWPQW